MTSTASTRQILADIQQTLADDLAATHRLIQEQLLSDVPMIQTVAQHIINGGGKRLRPLLVLLSARYFNYAGNEHHRLAAIIEFVHTATLLHDDVVDASQLRRGQDTANQIWGNQISVLVGDFLYSRAFQLLTQINHPSVMVALAKATNAIAEGEITQLVHRHDPDIAEADYMEVIRRKTACLFSAAAETGALLAGCTPAQQKAFADYGLHLGILFQIVDDLLDYTADKSEMGKNKGDDLSEGRATLPLIYTLRHCDSSTAEKIRAAIQQGDSSQFDIILAAMHQTQAIEYTLLVAQKHAEQAWKTLHELPLNTHREPLEHLIDFVLHRNY